MARLNSSELSTSATMGKSSGRTAPGSGGVRLRPTLRAGLGMSASLRCGVGDRLGPSLSGLDARPVIEGVDVELVNPISPGLDIFACPAGGRHRFVYGDLNSSGLGDARVPPHDFPRIANDDRDNR